MTHAAGPYRATTCRGRELNYGSHTYFVDHTRTWRAFPDEWSAQCRGHLRDSTNMKDKTHPVISTRRIWNDDYDGQMIVGDLGGLKFPDICLTGEKKKPEKTSPRKPVPTGDRTRARCVTSALATTSGTAVDTKIITMPNQLISPWFYIFFRGENDKFYKWCDSTMQEKGLKEFYWNDRIMWQTEIKV